MELSIDVVWKNAIGETSFSLLLEV